MKILFITPRFDNSSGGDGIYALRLSSELIKHNLELNILTIKNNNFVHISFKQKYFKKFEQETILLKRIDQTLFGRNIYSINARKSLKRILNSVQPEIIHIHGIHNYFTISCSFELKKYKKPVIFTIHDYKIICGNAGLFSDNGLKICKKCLLGKYMPAMFERCKKNSLKLSIATSFQMGLWNLFNGLAMINSFLIGSNSTFNLLKSNKKISSRFNLIIFPKPKKYIAENEIRISNKINIGFIGRFVPLKGVTIFAKSVKNIKQPVHLFGDGIQEVEVKSILQNKENVVFHGWKSIDDISNILNIGSIVVLPYLAYENTCLTLVECMSRGCCVIGTSRGYIAELIVHKRNGLLIADPTSENFRRGIEFLLSNPSQIIRMGQEAIKTVEQLPTMSEHAKNIINHYNIMIDKKD